MWCTNNKIQYLIMIYYDTLEVIISTPNNIFDRLSARNSGSLKYNELPILCSSTQVFLSFSFPTLMAVHGMFR